MNKKHQEPRPAKEFQIIFLEHGPPIIPATLIPVKPGSTMVTAEQPPRIIKFRVYPGKIGRKFPISLHQQRYYSTLCELTHWLLEKAVETQPYSIYILYSILAYQQQNFRNLFLFRLVYLLSNCLCTKFHISFEPL